MSMRRSEGLARTRLFRPWGREPEGGGQVPAVRVARCRTWSLVDIRLGPVKARRGSSGTCMGPYLSRTPILVHRVIRQGPSRPVGTYWPHRPKFGQVQKHQIWFEVGLESTVWPETKTK